MRTATRRALAAMLILEAVYLAGVVVVVLPFALASAQIDGEDSSRVVVAAAAVAASAAAAVLVISALGLWRRWIRFGLPAHTVHFTVVLRLAAGVHVLSAVAVAWEWLRGGSSTDGFTGFTLVALGIAAIGWAGTRRATAQVRA